jgi:AhpD family alkylhydroperoxidase
MSYGRAVQEQPQEPSRALRRAIPEVPDGCSQTHAAAFPEDVVEATTEELTGLAIVVSKETDGCIASHARGAARTGETGRRLPRRSGSPSR